MEWNVFQVKGQWSDELSELSAIEISLQGIKNAATGFVALKSDTSEVPNSAYQKLMLRFMGLEIHLKMSQES